MTSRDVLQHFFGYASFRAGQEELVNGILEGRDVFGIMPTGGGKSICYQVPAMMLPGITLVISPLIALMKDQVMGLEAGGIPCAYINSSLSIQEIREIYADLRYGVYKILYVAPERLMTDGLLSLVQEVEVSMVAVDEAHCISQWGQDFRPSYLHILDFLHQLPRRPIVAAFTATATEQVRQDIVRILELQDPLMRVTGFDRPNLSFEVLHPRDKMETLLELLEARRGSTGIVYCATRKDTDAVCEALQQRGFSAEEYHAGLSQETRRENQEAFVLTGAGSWWPPTPLAWASTNPMWPM